MAGRGTDIKLGEGVKELGGLYIIGTERHESRRIDNQLRGRSGRQGDPGASQFYVSMDDDLMRIFGGDKIQSIMKVVNFPEDQPIENKFLSSSIQKSQTRVEGRNFDIRKHVVEYDDVMNYHREIIYKKRKDILFADTFIAEMVELMKEFANNLVATHDDNGKFDYKEIYETLNALYNSSNTKLTFELVAAKSSRIELLSFVEDYLLAACLEIQDTVFVSVSYDEFVRRVYLGSLDMLWMEHIDSMSNLRQNVSLQAYGQRDPLLVYKNQGYMDFQKLLGNIKALVVQNFFRASANVS